MQEDGLKQKYGLITTITMVVGTVIGVGIFLRAPKMSLSAGGDSSAVLWGWIIAALMIIPIALIIAEIASTSKKTGGLQNYASETWNDRFGFGVGFAQSFFYIPANLVFMVFLTAEYTLKVTNMTHLGFTGIAYLAMFYALALFVINFSSGKLGGQIQVVATFVKLIPLVLIGIVGAFYFGDKLSIIGTDPNILNKFNANSGLPYYVKIAAVIPAALFAFDGWVFVGIVSKEIKNPGRNIPLAIVGGMLSIAVLYLLFTFASFNVADPKALATGGISNKDIASLLFGNFFGNIINLFVLVSAIGVANANTLVLIRAPYALAQSRKFIGSNFLGKLNKKTELPVNSGIVGLIITLGFLLIPFWLGMHSNGNIYGLFIDSAVLLFFVFYAIVCIGVVRMRFSHPNLERPFKTPLIGLFLAMGIVGAIFGIYGLISDYKGALIQVGIFVLLSCAGFLLYSFTKPKE